MTALRVLHVDDEPDIREVVEMSLGLDPDIVMRSCASGDAALVVTEGWTPDIMLLDVMMPVMDGPATLASLRSNPRTADIPVVFMTARAQSRELDRFRALGAVGVIPKPFDPMTLAASLRTYIEPPDVRLDAMRHKFLQRVDGDLVALSGHWSALEKGADAPSSLAGIRSIAHGLAGAGGVFGFDEISDAAAALEEAVIVEDCGQGSTTKIEFALERLRACVETNGGRPKSAQRVFE